MTGPGRLEISVGQRTMENINLGRKPLHDDRTTREDALEKAKEKIGGSRLLSDRLERVLDHSKVSELVRMVDMSSKHSFDSDLQLCIEYMLKSDSLQAFEAAAFLLTENRRAAAPLVPFLVELHVAASTKSSSGNRIKKPQLEKLLLSVASTRYVDWSEQLDQFCWKCYGQEMYPFDVMQQFYA